MILIALLIVLDSKGGAIYKQSRIGKKQVPFGIYKFRTMHIQKTEGSQITVGSRDSRITRIGYYLRKHKLDEVAQLFNILLGQMSFVGPRPEVAKYVNLYNEEQLQILDVKPGLVDYASLEYFEESDLLEKATDPEKEYIEVIMPAKLILSKKYIQNRGMATDIQILLRTIGKILSSGTK
jgi:lipopolysaccharide/colanic/teichoic acid biosynthesis glycosyltransferase